MTGPLQVIGGQMYIGGETLPFAQIQDRFKIMMSHMWSRYKYRLPDVDIMIQFDDWMIPNLTGAAHVAHRQIARLQLLPSGLLLQVACDYPTQNAALYVM